MKNYIKTILKLVMLLPIAAGNFVSCKDDNRIKTIQAKKRNTG